MRSSLDDEAEDVLVGHHVVHSDSLSGELSAVSPDHGVPEGVLEVPVDELAHVSDGHRHDRTRGIRPWR